VVAAVISGVVVLAGVLLAAAIGLLALVVLERRRAAPSPDAKFLDGLRRVELRVRRTRG